MGAWFEALNGAILRHGFHPFYAYAFTIWLVLLGVRAWFWRRRKYVHCERCEHEGFAKNTVRGSWKAELVRFLLFVPPGFFMHILMGLYLSYFLIRWFPIRECAVCGSEKLEPLRAPRAAPSAGWGKAGMAGYLLMVGVSVAGYFFIRAQGEQLPLPEALAETARRFAAPPSDALWTVLLALAVVIVAARALGMLFKRLGQPPVMGEIIAGIALGPSLLGAVAPGVSSMLLPAHVAPFLGTIANIGVVLFMFLVGLELNTEFLRGRAQAAVTISHASMLAPFLLGAGLAYFLYDTFATAGTSFTVFSLFAGVSLSVTAFPVLARILTDNDLQRTPLGATALTCASVDDVTAWLLLALASSVAVAQPGGMVATVLMVAAYLAVMMLAVRPIMARVTLRVERGAGGVSSDMLAVVFVGLLLSAMATEAIGIHALFGAFLFGAFISHDSRLAAGLRLRLQDTVVVLFLPAFFAFTGMRTELGLLSEASDWWTCAAIIAVATVGKFGGTSLAARLTGFDWRESVALGALMNTRGLMELIVLNVGLDMGVLTPRLFTMLVIMAVVTTFATNPLIRRLMRMGAFSATAHAKPHVAG